MAVIDNLFKQIIGQNTASQWTGEGYGSAEANAKAMAKLLADAGITDIKQFGKVDKYEPVTVTGYTLNGNTVQNPSKGKYYEMVYEGESDNGPQYRRRDLTPQEIAQVQPSYGVVDSVGDGENSAVIRPATNVVERDGKLVGVTGQTWGNKATGQAVNRGTGRWEWQGGDDLFSGTGEGEGNTAFRVQMSADGTPVFYTTQGSSSDVANIMPLIQLALAATGAGGALGNALLGAGANQIAAGALGGALLGGGTAALAGQNVLKGALLGGAGGALSGYLNPATGEISATPTEGSIPVSADDIAGLTASDFGIDYSLSNGTAMNQLTDMGGAQGLQAGRSANLTEMGGGQGFQFNVGAPVTSVAEAVNAIATMNGSVNPANLPSMGGGQGLTYQTPSGLVTEGGTLNFGGTTGNNSVISQGGIDTAYNIGNGIGDALNNLNTGVQNLNLPVIPTTPVAPIVPIKPITPSDIIKTISTAATIATIPNLINNVTKPTSTSGYSIVPVPTNWKSPPPTGVAEFTPLTPIDFGSKDLLKGTQWEKFLDPNYNKTTAMPNVPTNPSNMSFNQLMGVLGNTSTSMPTQNVSINDVIAGIQSQYGQTPTGSVG